MVFAFRLIMLLQLLEKIGRKHTIYGKDHVTPYMHRYYLLFNDKIVEEEFPKLPINIMLHCIRSSDPDDLHDHPWWYVTIILKGGYWEVTPKGKFWRGIGHFRIDNPRNLHRIEIPNNSNGSWSLFLRGPKIKDWGFMQKGKWISHKKRLR